MRVLFVSPSFFPATYYGGPIFMNQALCAELAESEEIELQVLTTDAAGPDRRIDATEIARAAPGKFPITYCRRNFYPDVSIGLLARLPQKILLADVVHLHGVYCFSTIPTLALSALLGKPVVWSASGALQRWTAARRQQSKTKFEKLCDLFCARKRVVLHYATEAEALESKSRLPNAAEVIIPFGVSASAPLPDRPPRGGPLRLLYIGRLHPIKGIENLVRSLAIAKSNVRLTICGAGEATYEASLRSLVIELGLAERVKFLGAVTGDAKEDQFHQADVCVLPSFKESFAAVVTESLVRGVPVIASDTTPWQALGEVGCGLWVSNKPESLAQAIDRAGTLPLNDMGNRGREWMRREFSWERCATAFIDTYRNLLDSQGRNQIDIARDPSAALPR